MLRLAGRNTKAIRQLELTYGGGKTHTLVALRHLAHDPAALPDLPAVEQFRSHAVFYTRWTQLDRFQRTRGILRTFAVALRDAEPWDPSPLVGPGVFLPAPGRAGLAEAARELTGVATREVVERGGHDWAAILEGELEKARTIQREQPGLTGREAEQAVCAVFLSSQPIGQKALTPDLVRLVGAARPDRIELEQGLRRWTELSWFLDDAEFAPAAAARVGPAPLPKAWRLGNRPNLQQMHHDACANRVTSDAVERRLLAEVRSTKSLIQGAKTAGARVHLLPDRPRDVEDDGEFHFVVLPPRAVSESGNRAGRRAASSTRRRRRTVPASAATRWCWRRRRATAWRRRAGASGRGSAGRRCGRSSRAGRRTRCGKRCSRTGRRRRAGGYRTPSARPGRSS